MKGRLKVGVTVPADVQDAHGLLWSSGVHQNAVFLLMLLQRLPDVELAAVVSCPDGATEHRVAELFGFAHCPQAEAIANLDVIIELGVRADAVSMRRFRERGGRLVSYMAANVMAMNFEALANDAPYGELMSGSGFDAVWITPQHWRMNRSYAALTRSPNVELAPHIWSPALLMQSAARLKTSPFRRTPEPGVPRSIAVFDPNVNVLKTFHLPLLVCEQAYRQQPELIGRVLLFNAAHLVTDPNFSEFCAATELGRDGRLFAEARFPLTEVMGVHANVVVTHQWENALNYLYWDVLYLGWPLIHDCEDMSEVGHYYPAFDPRAGGAALCEALDTDAGAGPIARDAVLDRLWRVHIDNPVVQHRYSELLEKVAA